MVLGFMTGATSAKKAFGRNHGKIVLVVSKSICRIVLNRICTEYTLLYVAQDLFFIPSNRANVLYVALLN